ncbi:tetratricopeptide repeat protein [Parendozoicomonas haliclonae]|uniref:Tetratrico peptide repeat protein n=1 Tax=Parendozoicomonas haliclonae TaxID=1960125 RepID=A0A1X7AIV4_9GAMM|nr:tetratricopeptide repeat protein [Parendozoicomonas haliclonae]SMA44291.1 Tetratrico peptide repeat protein [Parendozoicomonas haliclonae]
MNNLIEQAIQLRKAGQYAQSLETLQALVADPLLGARAHLYIAWNYDAQGLEREAIPHYQQALNGQLEAGERFDVLLGLASSLRCLGEYKQAADYFVMAREEFPNKQEILPFQAMNLYNTGDAKAAVAMLLNLLVETTNSEDIRAYQDAIRFYAEDLDKTW